MHRRAFLSSLAALSLQACRKDAADSRTTPATQAPEVAAFRELRGFCDGVPPIAASERADRRARARAALREAGAAALLLEAGETLDYFTGVRWGRSERPLLWLLPAEGEPVWIAPAFEEGTLRERAGADAAVRPWNEHESPYERLAALLAGEGSRRIAVDPWARQFVVDGARAAVQSDLVSGTAVIRACRAVKSPAELALLRRANEATKAALRAAAGQATAGMREPELAALVEAAQQAAGLQGTWALVLFGANAAYPHGTQGERRLARGELILVDAGGALHGYQSDVTRTWPFGPVGREQARAWAAVQRAQSAALAKIRRGTACEAVDAAARAEIAAAGYGEDYARFTHRLGHGIGLQTHEDPYLVRGNALRLEVGMTMSVEPGVYVPGALGVRLEDIVAVTPGEPEVFGPRALSIEAPFG